MSKLNAPVKYVADFMSSEHADKLFAMLWDKLNWEERSPARLEYWTNVFDRAYTYGSGDGERTYQSRDSNWAIEEVRDMLYLMTGVYYEGCFLNGYKGKDNGLTWHADASTMIDHAKPIAIVTLGEGRQIDFMKIGDKSTKESLFLDDGSLCLMQPGMQDTHFHQIPKAGYVVKRPRISLTFRSLLS